MVRLIDSDDLGEDHAERIRRVQEIQETYIDNIVDWAFLPEDEAKASTEARTRRLLNLLFNEEPAETEAGELMPNRSPAEGVTNGET